MQRLSGSHKALVEMQDDVAELLRSATRDYANTKVCVLVCAMICRSLLSRMSGFALVGAWWKWQLQKTTHVFMWCVWMYMKLEIYIWACMCNIYFVCAGESRANPVCAEFHWGWSSPADCSGRLSQPTHGESPYVLCYRRRVLKSNTFSPTNSSPLLSLSMQDYVQALTGLCYDGVEGLIYLVLFSFVTALMFSSIVCSVPHTWPGKR